VNSQEELRRKKMMQDLALNMNTLPISTSERLDMLNANTPSEKIVKIIKAAEEKAQAIQQQQQELEQKALQAKDENEKAKIAAERANLELRLASEEKQAYIKTRGYLGAEGQDLDSNKIPDAFEYEKFTDQSQKELEKLGIHKDKLQLEREKEENRVRQTEQELMLKQRALELKDRQIEQSARNVRIMDKGKFTK
jgi:hypothetical protein